MNHTIQEILEFIEEHDVKFIRLAFCDLLGNQKNISVMPRQLPRIFEEGILFDGSAIAGFGRIEESDLLLMPDSSTFDILPWRPQSGSVIRFFCSVHYPDKTPLEVDCRSLLKQRLTKVKQEGYQVLCGTECEFYLFKTDEQGSCTWIPHDQGGYFDMAPLDKGEDIRRDICLTLEEMGIEPESSHHEQGPGQHEVDFQYRDGLTACDQLITFKWAVQTISELHGLYASFLPKPIESASGNGLHINLSLYQNGKNSFQFDQPELLKHFIAGILAHSKEMALFLNPDHNSYQRLGEDKAPKYISWSHSNRTTLVRVPRVEDRLVRCEVRNSDPLCNPYLAVNLLVAAGMDGIENKLELMDECTENLEIMQSALDTLPRTLEEAVNIAKNSEFIKQTLPSSLIDYYVENRTQLLHKK